MCSKPAVPNLQAATACAREGFEVTARLARFIELTAPDMDRLGEDAQVDFKGKAKAFCRTCDFLSSVIPYKNAEWEKLSILLNLLTPKLPAPQEADLAKGILEAIDMDSYRVEKKAAMKIALADTDAEIAPVPADAVGRVDKVIANLRKMGDRRPKKLKQFQRHLKSLLGPDATDDAVQSLLANLLAADAVRVSGEAVEYTPKVTLPRI